MDKVAINLQKFAQIRIQIKFGSNNYWKNSQTFRTIFS